MGIKKNKNQGSRKKSIRKLVIKTILWSITSIIILCASTFVYVLLEIPAPLPSVEQLKKVKNPEASRLIDRNGKEIDRYYVFDRIIVPYSNISPYAINALVSTEDARFYDHNGIDFRSYPRVIIKSVLLGDRSSGGGSTITQQLAKNLFPRQDFGAFSMVINKIREMIIATRFEKCYDKKEILALYLNTVPFGEGSYGIESASKTYFNKPSKKLNIQEAAMLIGLLKANTYYNPFRHFERAVARKNVVLNLMHENDLLENLDLDSLQLQKIVLNTEEEQVTDEYAAYFKAYVEKQLQEILSHIKSEEGESPSLYTDGLKVYTTLDLGLQKAAEKAVHRKMIKLQHSFNTHWSSQKPWDSKPELLKQQIEKSSYYQALVKKGLTKKQITAELNAKRKMSIWQDGVMKTVSMSTIDSIQHYLLQLQTGFVALNPSNGSVMAWVGGTSHQIFPYDHVYQAKRQIGSTFKPIVYATALQKGVSPCTYVKASQETFAEQNKEWSPKNADNQYEGKYSMSGALMESVNTVAVKTLEAAGIDNTIKNARLMGITSDIPEVPSIALGTPSLSLLEITSAYTTFAHKGHYTAPYTITKIEDKSGKVIWELPQKASVEVFDDKTVALMNEMLQKVADEGTARSLRSTYGIHNDLAGKTGTTQNNADGWFIGYSPALVVGVWVGCDNPAIHFRSTALGQGAATALPIFADFYQTINTLPDLNKITKSRFSTLPANYEGLMDCDPFKEDKNFFEWLFGKKDKKEKENKQGSEGKKKSWWKNIFGKNKD